MIIRQATSPDFLSPYNARQPVIAYNNIVTVGNIEATTEDADFPVANLANPATHLKWKEAAVNSPETDEYITVAVPQDTTVSPVVAGTVDYLAIAKHNFGTAGCTVSVETTSDVSSPITGYVELATTTPTDDTPIIFQFTPTQASYIRLRIQPGTAMRELAVLYTGVLLTLERSIKVDVTHTPINLGRRNDVLNGMSESGHFLGRILRNTRNESKAEFAHITAAWYRANFDPFVIASKDTPFFWAWDPEGNPTDVGYCWLVNDSVPEFNPVTGRFAVNLDMRGLA